jgi:hypothetical protein
MNKFQLKHSIARNKGALHLPPDTTIGQVIERLETILRLEELLDDYFRLGPCEPEREAWLKAQPWAFIGQTRHLACFATSQADGNAHNFWVVLLAETSHLTIHETTSICFGKTYLGKEHALHIANRCATLLDS